MIKTQTGHIKTSGIKQYPQLTLSDTYFGLLKGVIEEVTYIDDKLNNSYEMFGVKAVQYNIRIVGSHYDGLYIRNVMDSTELGGKFNYSETIRTEQESNKNTSSGTKDSSLMMGDFVLIMFVGGNLNAGIIIKGFPQPNNEKIGTKKEQGKRAILEFNGIEFNVDKEGNLRLRIVGNKDKDGKITNEDGVDSTILLYKNGDLEYDAYGDNKNEIKDVNNSSHKDLRIKFIKEDKKLETYINEHSVIIDESGIDVKTKDNCQFKIDNDSKQLETHGCKVLIGDSGLEPMVLFNKLSAQIDHLVAEIKSHFHPHGMGPTGAAITGVANLDNYGSTDHKVGEPM